MSTTPRGVYDRPTLEIFFNDFKAVNPRIDFTAEQIRLTNVGRNSDPATRVTVNTSATMVGRPERGRRGEWQVSWNRRDIAKIFAQCNVYVPYTGQTKLSELLGSINAQYPIALADTDIYDASIPAKPTLPLTLSIPMHAANPAFIGTLTLTLGN